jgi:hypothetical protein
MEAIVDDIQNMEEDVKKINCMAILDFMKHSLKCIQDSIFFLCKR